LPIVSFFALDARARRKTKTVLMDVMKSSLAATASTETSRRPGSWSRTVERKNAGMQWNSNANVCGR
jgi:hypothetical protein